MSAQNMIAIVDDHAPIRAALADLLRSCGYATEQFGSAEQFLARRNGVSIDCIVLDVRMPGMSGLELLEALRAEGSMVPTIFMTSYSDEQTRKTALAAGACGFLTKPVDDEVLISLIRAAIDA